MEKWEYLDVRLEWNKNTDKWLASGGICSEGGNLHSVFGELGEKGWEVISLVVDRLYATHNSEETVTSVEAYRAFLKRPIKAEEPFAVEKTLVTFKQVEVEKGNVDVILLDCGQQKIEVMKAIRELRPELTVREAKELIETRWATIKQGTNPTNAEKIKIYLESLGAVVELR